MNRSWRASGRARRQAGLLGLVAASAVALSALAGAGPQPESPGAWEMAAYEAVSLPSDVRELAFGIRGRIADVAVVPGTPVSAGQAVARMDDLVQQRTVALARLQAQDRTQLDAAEATVEFRRNDMEQVRIAFQGGGVNEREMNDAEYRLLVAEIELAAARNALEEAALVLEREEARLAEMTLHCPIDGVVVDLHKRGGEAVDEQTTVVTVIQPNPLWIDVSVRTRDALRLRAGQRAEVVWQDVDGVAAMGGHVTYISPAGHAGARQVKVRVEVPNDIGLPTGLHATVEFLAPDEDGPVGADALGPPRPSPLWATGRALGRGSNSP